MVKLLSQASDSKPAPAAKAPAPESSAKPAEKPLGQREFSMLVFPESQWMNEQKLRVFQALWQLQALQPA